jgi:hypothetical protein
VAHEGGHLLADGVGVGAEDKASAGEEVQGGELLRQNNRLTLGDDERGGAEADALGDCGREQEGGDGLQEGPLGLNAVAAARVGGIDLARSSSALRATPLMASGMANGPTCGRWIPNSKVALLARRDALLGMGAI